MLFAGRFGFLIVPSTPFTFLMPSLPRFFASNSSISGWMSTPYTVPFGPMTRAMRRAKYPVPTPMSATLSPALSLSDRMSVWGFSSNSRDGRSSHPAPRCPIT